MMAQMVFMGSKEIKYGFIKAVKLYSITVSQVSIYLFSYLNVKQTIYYLQTIYPVKILCSLLMKSFHRFRAMYTTPLNPTFI